MRTTMLTAALACTLGLAASGFGGSHTGQTSCGSLSLGPGSVTREKGGGATCLLLAYRHHCSAARYRLSIFGVDTIATRTFVVGLRGGRCGIDVATTFEVVPSKARPAGQGRCRGVRRAGKEIVAFGCSGGGLPPSVSLTAA